MGETYCSRLGVCNELFLQAEDGIRDLVRSRGLGDVYKRQDPISGSAHFRTPVSKGLEIIAGLRGHTTGYAVPTLSLIHI